MSDREIALQILLKMFDKGLICVELNDAQGVAELYNTIIKTVNNLD